MTMVTIELELLEKIGKLDAAKQRQVLAYVDSLLPEQGAPPPFDFEEWLTSLSAFRDKLTAKYGPHHFGSVQDILDEVREERLNDLMGGR